ncbi:hypothetical protein P4N68_07740 [Corynebacterium felinum]|uniref:Uncharacterized protein n=1 Tax=Corynebacterium felinum TaxID=131318 RepID=A0ABU2B7X6_9CORY|nr:DUF6541 family protein [Corynebacterium felinum]MDF5820969.1 hypothetical protein [Corynebacterium felinum]MDR7354714.1 hypothetical protein [Corynebacterium felinum]WJY94078.1 hypothetical protein CFELI_02180 [Corynebacterium felinum]
MDSGQVVQWIVQALTLVVVPGALFNWISGVRLPWATAAAIPTTTGIVALSGWLLSQFGQDFHLRTVAVCYLFFLLIAIMWRASFQLARTLRDRRATRAGHAPEKISWKQRAITSLKDPSSFFSGRWILPLSGIIAGAWLIIARTTEIYLALPKTFMSIVQGWDVHWHANEVRFIMDEKIADPTRMGELLNIDGQFPSFYPSGWHAVTALIAEHLGLHPIQAVNFSNLLLPAVCLPMSVALLAWKIVGNRGPTAQLAAGLAPVGIFVSPVLYWIPTYVGMWPYAFAIAMTGIVAALYMSVPYSPIRILATILGFVGVVATHPATVTVVVLIVGFWWLLRLLWSPARATKKQDPRAIAQQRAQELIDARAESERTTDASDRQRPRRWARRKAATETTAASTTADVTADSVPTSDTDTDTLATADVEDAGADTAQANADDMRAETTETPDSKPSFVRRATRGLWLRLRDVILLALPASIAIAVMIPQLLAGLRQHEEVSTYIAPDATTRAESWQELAFQGTRHTNEFGEINWTWLTVCAIVGLLVAMVWRKNFWIPVFLFFSMWLGTHALAPYDGIIGTLLNPISSLHYSSAHRLIIPVAMVQFALAGVGVATVLRFCTGAAARNRWVQGMSLILATAIGVGIAVWAVPQGQEKVIKGTGFSVASIYKERTVTSNDVEAFEWLAQQPRAYEGKILGEYSDGNGWMYAYNGLPSISRHYLLPHVDRDMPSVRIYHYPELIGAGNHGDPIQRNQVDEAVADLNLNYIFLSPPAFWHFQQHNISRRIFDAPGLTLVYRNGNTQIFAVNAQFSDAELSAMRASSAEPLPAGPTRAEVGLVSGDANKDIKPYYHRPRKSAQPSISSPSTQLSGENTVNADDNDERATKDAREIAEQWRHYDKYVGRAERGDARP